ncbi:MAG: hypothetical protein WCA35_11495 [Kovacikia sp.]
MAVKVFVWPPKGGNVGHSSMQVGTHTYISLWPGHGRKGFARSVILKLTMNVKRSPFYRDYASDREAEGFDPFIVELNTLNEDAMQKYWEKVQISGLKYELTEFNCSTIIANALYIGSSLQPNFQPLAEVDTYVGVGIPLGEVEAWEPKHILQYARDIKRLKG